jgi:hypothetical protein
MKPSLLRVNLGSGNKKILSEYVNVDIDAETHPDILMDCLDYLKTLDTNSVYEIRADHFFEHIDGHREYLEQFSRVLHSSGFISVTVPHFSNPYFYSDPTHSKFFGLYTFCYYLSCTLFSRKVPKYAATSLPLFVSRVRLKFKLPRIFLPIYPLAILFSILFNLSPLSQEIYEYFLSGLIPCYEITYTIEKASQCIDY